MGPIVWVQVVTEWLKLDCCDSRWWRYQPTTSLIISSSTSMSTCLSYSLSSTIYMPTPTPDSTRVTRQTRLTGVLHWWLKFWKISALDKFGLERGATVDSTSSPLHPFLPFFCATNDFQWTPFLVHWLVQLSYPCLCSSASFILQTLFHRNILECNAVSVQFVV